MTFCKEDSWDSANAKCCLDGYSIEHVLDETGGSQKSGLERKFLDQYPCVNGVELESLADKIQGDKPSNPPKTSTPIPENKPCNIRVFSPVLRLQHHPSDIRYQLDLLHYSSFQSEPHSFHVQSQTVDYNTE